MGSNWEAMGFFRWPITLCLVIVVVFGLRSAFKLFLPGATPDSRTKAWLDGILPWGFLAFLSGILGSVVGIILAIQAVEAVGEFRGTAMAPGIKLTLLSMGFGTLVCVVAVFVWWVLQLRWRLLEADAADTRMWEAGTQADP